MFTIIGADQNQYGPVSGEEVREWIHEGRADGRTLALREGTTEWKPLAAFPEFAAAFAGASPSTMPPSLSPNPPRAATIDEVLARDYELDIFGCITRAWNLARKNIGPVVGISILVMLGQAVVNQLVGLISAPSLNQMEPPTTLSLKAMIDYMQLTPGRVALIMLSGLLAAPIQCVFLGGLYKYYIKLIRGERAGIADAFSGFSEAFVQLAILGLVMNILITIGFFLCVLPAIYLIVALMFSIPLVMDKGLNWQEAIKMSLKMTNKHWFMVLGLMLVVGLVGVSGVILCCVGIVFTIPVSGIAMMYAYEDIFGR